jgi:mono/diheme cytochrome c family protein
MMKLTFCNRVWGAVAASLAIIVAGCSEAPPPEFRLDMVQVALNDVGDEYQEEIADVLAAMFGTPDNPQVLPETGLDQMKVTLAAGPAWTDANDVTHGLYRRHCVHCHGITGDGRGPTARFLDPYPRDYRRGVFKFKSTFAGAKPTSDDLTRILHNGIPGTSMPSFSLLPPPEVESLVEYVRYLAIRGEMEKALIDFVAQELGETEAEDADGNPIMNEDGTPQIVRPPLDPAANPEQAAVIKEDLLTPIVEAWQTAEEQVVAPAEETIPADDRSPEEIAASVTAGRELFFGKRANCFTCHGPTALGDGQQNDFDDWTKEINRLKPLIESTQSTIESLQEAPKDETEAQYAERMARIEQSEATIDRAEDVLATLYPVRNAIPRNLRQGVYRGGRRRLDVFYRIHAGIVGVPMPGVGASGPGGQGTLTEEESWQLVDYVLSLPYEPASGPNQDLPRNNLQVTR